MATMMRHTSRTWSGAAHACWVVACGISVGFSRPHLRAGTVLICKPSTLYYTWPHCLLHSGCASHGSLRFNSQFKKRQYQVWQEFSSATRSLVVHWCALHHCVCLQYRRALSLANKDHPGLWTPARYEKLVYIPVLQSLWTVGKFVVYKCLFMFCKVDYCVWHHRSGAQVNVGWSPQLSTGWTARDVVRRGAHDAMIN